MRTRTVDRRAVRLGIVAAALAGVAAVLGLRFSPGGPTLVFVVATVAALGTRAGIALGGLALVAALATAPVLQPTLVLGAAGVALAGLGLGLLGRELDRHLDALPSRFVGGVLVAVIAALALALPDGRVHLADAAGAPLTLPALLVDGPSFMRVVGDVPASLPLATPGGSLTAIALLALLVAGLVLAIAHVRLSYLPPAGNGRETSAGLARGAWELAALAAGLGVVAAALGLGQLAFGSVELDAARLREAYDLAVSPDGSIIGLAAPPTAELALWSRPWVDGLRLLSALALLVLALRSLRTPTPAPATAPGISKLLPVALGVVALGAALIAAASGLHGAALALLAGLVLGLGALVATRSWPTGAAPLAPFLALLAGALLWVYAWLVTPLFGA